MNAPAFMDARRWTLLAVVALAIAMRLLVARAMPQNLSRDDDSYRFIANQVATQGRFARELTGRAPAVTAYRPPLYPMLLAGMELVDPGAKDGPRDWAVLALNVCLGGATALLAALIAMRIVPAEPGRQWRAGLAAGTLAACDPLLVYNATLAMTETLAAALAAGAMWAILAWLQRPCTRLAIVIGLFLGLASLARPIFAPWLVLVVFLIWRRAPASTGRKVASFHATVITLTAIVAISPWAVRNFVVMGKPIASTTHGGYTLMLGNNPHFYKHLRTYGWDVPWDDSEFQRAWARRFRAKAVDEFNWSAPLPFSVPDPVYVPDHFDEIADDQFARSLAVQAIQAEPWHFAEACAYRLWQLWNPTPNKVDQREAPRRAAFRRAVRVWNVVVYLLAAWGAFCIWRQADDPARVWLMHVLALAIVLSLVHTFYWSNLRMRVPIMPAICVLAAIGVSGLLSPSGAQMPPSEGG